MASSILSKTFSLMVILDSQNINISPVYTYISQVLKKYGVPNPTLVSGVVIRFDSTGKNLIENLARVAEEINNNNELNFSVGLGFSISQDSINAVSKSITDSITQFEDIKPTFVDSYPQLRPDPVILPDPVIVIPELEPQPGYGYGYDYGYDYGYYGGGEVVVETKPRICTKDMFRCPDGSLVSRDEYCNFRPCPEPQQSSLLDKDYGYGGEEVVI